MSEHRCSRCHQKTAPYGRVRLTAVDDGVIEVLLFACLNAGCMNVDMERPAVLSSAVPPYKGEEADPVGTELPNATDPDVILSQLEAQLRQLLRPHDINELDQIDSARRRIDALGYLAARSALDGQENELTKLRGAIADVLLTPGVPRFEDLPAVPQIAYRLTSLLVDNSGMRSAAEQRRLASERRFSTANRDNNWANYAEAFSIFAKYGAEDSYCNVSAEHDELYAGPEPDIVTATDTQRLNELGWSPDKRTNCFRKFT